MTVSATPAPATDRPGPRKSPPGGRFRRPAVLAGGFAALLTAFAVLAACGSASAGSAGSSASPITTGGSQTTATGATGASGNNGGSGNNVGSGNAAGAANRPGASGTIAAVQSGSFEVQDTASQTTVRYTSTTDIQQTIKGGISDVTVGSCITAIAPVDRSAGTGATAAPATPSNPASTRPSGQRGGFPGRTEPSELTAGTVTIVAAVNGSCTNGAFGGGRGAFPSGTGAGRFPGGGTRPTGAAPTRTRTGTGVNRGTGSGFAGFGGIVSGTVAAVSGSKITVTVTEFTGMPGRTSGSSTAAGTATTPSTKTTTSTVTVTGATTYTKTVTAKPAAIKVGLCASAFGPADDTGAITATEIRLSDPTNGSCSAGVGGGFRGGFGGRGNGSGTGAPVTTHG